MTEKRFRVFKFPDVDKFGVDDDIAKVTVAFCDKKWEADYLCDLLNDLNDENEQLKNKYVDEFSLRETLQQDLQIAEAKIEQLQIKIERERNATHKQYEKWENEAFEKITELEKENEQLKKDNNELENEIEKLENRLWNCQNVR